MLYYAQILQKDTASSLALGLDTQEAAVVLHGIETPTASQDTLLEVADTADDTEQPTLGEILKVVNKCTASVNTLKDHFVGLWGGGGSVCCPRLSPKSGSIPQLLPQPTGHPPTPILACLSTTIEKMPHLNCPETHARESTSNSFSSRRLQVSGPHFMLMS